MSETGSVADAHSRPPASAPRGAGFAANMFTRIPAVQEELTLSAGALGTALLGLPVGLTAIVLVTTLCASSLQPMKP